jgi:hypothetical protein
MVEKLTERERERVGGGARGGEDRHGKEQKPILVYERKRERFF